MKEINSNYNNNCLRIVFVFVVNNNNNNIIIIIINFIYLFILP